MSFPKRPRNYKDIEWMVADFNEGSVSRLGSKLREMEEIADEMMAVAERMTNRTPADEAKLKRLRKTAEERALAYRKMLQGPNGGEYKCKLLPDVLDHC